MRYKFVLEEVPGLDPDEVVKELHLYLISVRPNWNRYELEELSDYVFEECDWKKTAKAEKTIPDEIIITYIREDWARDLEKYVKRFFSKQYKLKDIIKW